MVDTRFYKLLGPLSLAEVVDGLDVVVLDDKFLDENIQSATALAVSKPGDIAFLGSRKHKEDVATSKATACFVTDTLAEFVGAKNIIPIVSKSPRGHFARVVSKLYEEYGLGADTGKAEIARSATVHETAVVCAGAVIKENAVIDPYAVIGPGVQIGARTHIGSHVSIKCALIGDDCVIKSSAVIGGVGFGIARDEHGSVHLPHIGRVIIGDRVMIGSQTCVDRGQLIDTELHDDVKVDNLVQIAHNVRIGKGTIIAGHVGISGSCTLGENVQLAGNVGLSDHITIGDGASVIARAGVMHNIPAGEVWSGIPAMPFREHLRLVNATRKLIQKPKKPDNAD